MFKKRSRPTSVREKAIVEEEEAPTASGSATPAEDAGEEELEDTTQNIEELILLRKLRKAKQGIDLERLNRGDEKKVKKVDQDASDKFGLQSVRRRGEGKEDLDDETERTMRSIRSNNFTQQTNALDVDKHMLAYIEKEMAKRRGAAAEKGKAEEEAFDPQAELFKITERYHIEKNTRLEEEGSVTNSMGMLTTIPELDLGMENRLRNIEATEKAKREMMERRRNEGGSTRRQPAEQDYSAARYYRPNYRLPPDGFGLEDAKRQASGLIPSVSQQRDVPARPRTEEATDNQVYDRFRKRMKR